MKLSPDGNPNLTSDGEEGIPDCRREARMRNHAPDSDVRAHG